MWIRNGFAERTNEAQRAQGLRLKAVSRQPRQARRILFTAHRIERHCFIVCLRLALQARETPLHDGVIKFGGGRFRIEIEQEVVKGVDQRKSDELILLIEPQAGVGL